MDIYCSILGGGDYIIIEILSSFQAKEIFEFTPKEGISVFAIAYLQVQFIERIIELFSGAKVFGNKDEIENAKAESAVATAEAILAKLYRGCKKRRRRRQIKSLKKGLFLLGNRVTARNDSCILYCWSA